jgi:hypothetical protein
MKTFREMSEDPELLAVAIISFFIGVAMAIGVTVGV